MVGDNRMNIFDSIVLTEKCSENRIALVNKNAPEIQEIIKKLQPIQMEWRTDENGKSYLRLFYLEDK